MTVCRIAIAAALVACHAPARQAVEAVPAAPVVATTVRTSGNDVKFMQGMIGHHAQALDMTQLVAPRASRPDIRLLAERIDVSQKDEIALMRRWLQARGQVIPDADAHVHAAMGHGQLMPGMLTVEELDRIAGASGREFDRLFLQFMIRHHEGALTMVAELLTAQGTLDAETFRFVSDIDADQRAEIQRMQTLLKIIP